MIKEEIIANTIGQLGEIDIYQNGFKNTFCFSRERVFWFHDRQDLEVKYKIIGKLKGKEFNLKIDEAYFFINGIPFCCKITQINHHRKDVRSIYEVVIIICGDMRSLSSINTFDLLSLFKRYEGKIFDLEEERINNRFELLDLRFEK